MEANSEVGQLCPKKFPANVEFAFLAFRNSRKAEMLL